MFCFTYERTVLSCPVHYFLILTPDPRLFLLCSLNWWRFLNSFTLDCRDQNTHPLPSRYLDLSIISLRFSLPSISRGESQGRNEASPGWFRLITSRFKWRKEGSGEKSKSGKEGFKIRGVRRRNILSYLVISTVFQKRKWPVSCMVVCSRGVTMVSLKLGAGRLSIDH